MDYDNPYAIQEIIPTEPIAVDGSLPEVKRLTAFVLAFVSVAGSMLYVYVTVSGLGNANPWPMVIGATIISLISAVWTRDRLIAPLTCIAAIMSGASVAGSIRGWGYADMPRSLGIGAGCSVPAILLAVFVYWRRKEQLRTEVVTGLDDDHVQSIL